MEFNGYVVGFYGFYDGFYEASTSVNGFLKERIRRKISPISEN